MARIIGVVFLVSATLALGGCVGPYGYGYGAGNGYGGYGYGGGYGSSQPYASSCPVPVPVDPGYGGGYGGGYAAPGPVYAPQPQPYAYNYYGDGGVAYQPQPGETPPVPGQPYSTDSPGIDRRERNQANYIRQGLRSGELTPEEAKRLWAEQARIRSIEARLKNDGNLTPQERARLNNMLDRSNRDIYRARHNGVTAPPPNGTQPNNGTTVQPNATSPRMVQPNMNGPRFQPQPNLPGGRMAQPVQPRVQPMQPRMQPVQPRVQPAQPRVQPAQPRVQSAQPGKVASILGR